MKTTSVPAIPFLALAVLLFASIPNAGADLTYHLVDFPDQQNGHGLSGSITTDGTLGVLSASNILDWTWSISGPTNFTISDAHGTVVTGSQLIATATVLTFSFTTTHAMFSIGNTPAKELRWESYRPPSNQHLYAAWGPSGGNLWLAHPQNGSTRVIGVIVPEPSTLLLSSLAVSSVAIARLRRG